MFAIVKNGGKCRNFEERSQIKVFLDLLDFNGNAKKRYFYIFFLFLEKWRFPRFPALQKLLSRHYSIGWRRVFLNLSANQLFLYMGVVCAIKASIANIF